MTAIAQPAGAVERQGVDACAPKCPECRAEMAALGADRLPQCGGTHLPARRWACESEPCRAREIVVTLPTGEGWRADP